VIPFDTVLDDAFRRNLPVTVVGGRAARAMEILARKIAPLRNRKVGVRARIEGAVRELERACREGGEDEEE